MKYGILILSALLLLGLGLAAGRPALAGPTTQAATATPATTGTGAAEGARVTAPTPPANLAAREPNTAVGYFLPVCLIIGLIGAGIGAFIAIRRDTRKAARIVGPDAPRVY